jgi:hypothetical protein
MLPEMIRYEPATNTFVGVDGNYYAFDQSGNAKQVEYDFVNPWIPTKQTIEKTQGDTGTDWAGLVTSALTTLQTYQLNQINVERAKQGLPPINTSAYGTGVNVGLNPQTQQLVIYGGLALLAVLLIGSFTKGK